MQAQFEDIFKQMNVATGGADAPAAGAASSAAGASAPKVPGETSTKAATAEAGTDASFQETIRRTMERMQSSGDQATAAAASGGGDDFMSEMLKQLSSGEFGGEGGDEDFSKMLMGMMEQLTNKEILYEPMKELHDKFPEWFEKNKDSTPADDLKRYEEQRSLVAEIVGKFEESTYSDDKASDREYIVDRMQKVSGSSSLLRSQGSHERRTSTDNKNNRCKLQDHRPLTWSGTWHRHRKRSACQMINVIRNRRCLCIFGHAVLIYTHSTQCHPYTSHMYGCSERK